MVHIKVLVAGDEESSSTVLEVPDDVPAFRLLSTMVTRLHLPAKDPQGNLIDYTITHNRTGRILKNSDTLAGAGIGEEDVVTLAPHIIMGAKPGRAERPAAEAIAVTSNGAPEPAAAPASDSLAATIARALAKEKEQLAPLRSIAAAVEATSAARAESASPASAEATPPAAETSGAPIEDAKVAEELDSLSEVFSEEEVMATAQGSNGTPTQPEANADGVPATTVPLSLEELAGGAPAAPQVVEQPELADAGAEEDRLAGRGSRPLAASTRGGRASDLGERSQRASSTRPVRAAMSMDTPSASRRLNGPVPAEIVARLEEYRADENRWKALAWIFVGAIFGILLTVATADPFVTPTRFEVILLVISGLLAIICWFAGRDYSKRAERLKQSIGSTGSQDLGE